MKHKNKKTILVALVILLIILAGYAGYQLNKYWYTPRTIEAKHFLYADVRTDKNLTLEEVLGYLNDSSLTYIVIPKGGIYFYTLSPGWNFTRELEVTNIWDTPVEMTTHLSGNISSYLTINETEGTLGPQESRVLALRIKIPEDVLAGKYAGNLTIRLTPKKT